MFMSFGIYSNLPKCFEVLSIYKFWYWVIALWEKVMDNTFFIIMLIKVPLEEVDL